MDLNATVAALAALATTTVALLGLLVRRSFDKAAENRLRMETTIRAVELLSTADGKDAPKTQQAAALFALEELDQLEFALILLQQIWAADGITTTGALWLIDRGLTAKGPKAPELQELAAEILGKNPEKLLDSDGGLEFPNSVAFQWNLDLNTRTRSAVLVVLLKALLERPRSLWSGRCLDGVLTMLYVVMVEDPEPRLRRDAALALEILLRLPDRGGGIFLPAGRPKLYHDLRREVKQYLERDTSEYRTRQVRQLLEELERWLEADDPESPLPAECSTARGGLG